MKKTVSKARYFLAKRPYYAAEVRLLKIWTYVLAGIFLLAALFIYMIPTVIAFRNGHPKRVAIFFVNLLLGVTVLGYIGAMLWATAPAPASEK